MFCFHSSLISAQPISAARTTSDEKTTKNETPKWSEKVLHFSNSATFRRMVTPHNFSEVWLNLITHGLLFMFTNPAQTQTITARGVTIAIVSHECR